MPVRPALLRGCSTLPALAAKTRYLSTGSPGSPGQATRRACAQCHPCEGHPACLPEERHSPGTQVAPRARRT
eukprot:13855433-Alexandrium_andersonii.AAC.1